MAAIDDTLPLLPQVVALIESVGLSALEWQQEVIMVLLPGYSPVAAAVTAELHGRMGHFPSIVRMRPQAGSTPVQYEVAEIVNLQAARDAARRRRLADPSERGVE